jgi:hypothetical protein
MKLNYGTLVEEETSTETASNVSPESGTKVDEPKTSDTKVELKDFKKDARSIVNQLRKWNKLKGEAKNDEATSLKSTLPTFIEQGDALRAELNPKEIEVLDKATTVLDLLSKSNNIDVKESKDKAKVAMDELNALIESYQSLS